MKKLTAMLLASATACTILLCSLPTTLTAHAEYIPQTISTEIQPRLFTKIGVSILQDDTYVYAYAKNTFTLFPSTVEVTLRLYYSDTFTEDYTKMTLAASAGTDDLDINQELTARARKNKSGYWRAVAVYSENGGAKNTVQSDTVFLEVSSL